MIENVFRPTRYIGGKRIRSPYYSGRYTLERGQKRVTVALRTPDRAIAKKRLRDIVLEKQREAEGMIAPRVMREAANAPLVDLVAAYAADLKSRTTENHAKESLSRIKRVLVGAAWKTLADVNASSWIAWRAVLVGSAKTKKEYQTSVMAFLNWLVRTDRLAVNPLAKVDSVDIRGKAVRKSRAFTLAEFFALCSVAPPYRRLLYLFLTYTGARLNEARTLLRSDLSFEGKPVVLFRAENTKSSVKRSVPLKAELVAELLPVVGNAKPDALVFPLFPSDDALHADLRRAGIERKNAAGRVLHFHAFRKTFQTWGAVSGVGQRSAQELLGHSDPSLTANIYTDVAALALHDEVAKIPWYKSDAPTNALADEKTSASIGASGGMRSLLTQLVSLAQAVVTESKAGLFPVPQVAARHGFEP